MTEGGGAAGFLWRGLVPLIPFALLLNARLWRNVCPLGRVSEGRPGGDPVSDRPRIGLAILLFAAILPVRAVWLADSLFVTGIFLTGLGVGAFLLGRRRARRAGFCTTFCPMLPVELLYGQAPLIEVGRGACERCTLCTARACPQLSPSAAIAQHLGAGRHGAGWVRTPFGAFAAAFPGVITAFHVGDTGSPGSALLSLGVGAAVSWGLAAAIVVAFRPAWDRAILALGFGAIALWTWFALPGVAEAWGWPAGAPVLQLAGLAVSLTWLVRGVRRSPGPGPYPSPSGSRVRIT